MSVMIEGKEYFLIPFERLADCIGMTITPYNVRDRKVLDIFELDSISSDQDDSINLDNHNNRAGLWVRPSFWDDPSRWYLPYTSEKIDETVVARPRPTYCRCNGPAEDRRCFDTFTVESCCVRCHNRKRSWHGRH